MRLRWDIWVTLMVTAIIAVGVRLGVVAIIDRYNNPEEPQTVSLEPGTIGAAASNDTPRLESVDEITGFDGAFTIEVPKGEVNINFGSDFHNVRLASGEMILANINWDSIQETEQGAEIIYTLPVGHRIDGGVPDELKSEHSALITDFYIMMDVDQPVGETTPAVTRRQFIVEPDKEFIANGIMTVVIIITFALIRFIFVRKGIFPPIIKKRKRELEEHHHQE